MSHIQQYATKVIGTVLIAAVALATAALAIAGGPTLELYTTSSNLKTGDEVTLEVRMDTKAYDVSAVELHVSFPDGVFEIASFDEGAFLPVVLLAAQTDSDGGSITVGSGTTAKNGQGTIATLVLRALEGGTHTVTIDEATRTAAAGEAGDVTDTLTGITLVVSAGQSSGGGGGGGSSSGQGTSTVTNTSIAAVAYVGYTSTDWFRRGEAGDIVDMTEGEKNRGDFKS
jgi:hypothetical protein